MMALSNARILQTYHNSQRRLHQQSGQRLQLQPAGEQQQRQQSKVTSTAADASDKDKSVAGWGRGPGVCGGRFQTVCAGSDAVVTPR